MTEPEADETSPPAVAIIGMAGRFPGAASVGELWENLLAGKEGIERFSDEQLRASGLHPPMLEDPQLVKSAAVLRDIEGFDAELFGYSPREAELMDPQHRLALETSWQAFEDAGHDPAGFAGLVGVYAGCGPNSYLMHLLEGAEEAGLDGLQLTVGNEKDYLATRISYKLDLKGPSVSVQTACSTSLVSVHLACQGLLDYECDLALAGGVSVRAPQPLAYRYREGSILSPDGHCRAFDSRAGGTVYGNGLGFVILRRLEDAVAAGDRIIAVIRGSAINNDGAAKVGYTAPSVEGQAAVIRRALAAAAVAPQSIGYIETHGTGTPMGDPVEIAALGEALSNGLPSGSCLLGALKTNLGHLDVSAGVAGLIKTAMVLEKGFIPPTLHFERANPEIDFSKTRFRVVTQTTPWPRSETPRRAGVSSFGIGGTNAHVVLEEPPPRSASHPAARSQQLLVLSAATEKALTVARQGLREHLSQHPESELADVAFTLQLGRRPLACRQSWVAADAVEAVEGLAEPRPAATVLSGKTPRLVFLFPGQGAQYAHMARGLFDEEPVFRSQLDHCAEILSEPLGYDVRQRIYPASEEADTPEALAETSLTQPALFAVEYALAQQWMAWGLRPDGLLGHSLGEYVAACLAGVFSLEDALLLVSHRARLMQQQPRGAMLAVALSEEQVQERLPPELSLAATNAPKLCVVSGAEPAIEHWQDELERSSVVCQRLRVSHAFHSQLIEGVEEPFRGCFEGVKLAAPRLPFVSNLTGRWIEPAQATDPEYWVAQLRQTVRFAEGLQQVLDKPPTVLLEVGPGRTLAKLARQQGATVVSSLPEAEHRESSAVAVATALGRLWEQGIAVDWKRYHEEKRRRRVALPTYPFERQPHWFSEVGPTPTPRLENRAALENWAYLPSWRQTPPARLLPKRDGAAGGAWLLFVSGPLGPALAEQLRRDGGTVIEVGPGEDFSREGARRFSLNPRRAADYRQLLETLSAEGVEPFTVVHAWSVGPVAALGGESTRDPAQALGFDSVLRLAQALGERPVAQPRPLFVLTTGLDPLGGNQDLEPGRATLLGACRVIPLENPALPCRLLDLEPTENSLSRELLNALGEELTSAAEEDLVAYRDGQRWQLAHEPAPLPAVTEEVFRRGGCYLITGGLGGLGLALAMRLAKHCQARLILISRSALPPREEWDSWLAQHDPEDEVRRRLEGVLAIEALGSEVLVQVADVTSREQLAAAVAAAQTSFGALHGVFHLAGVPGMGLVQVKTLEVAAETMRPKVEGTQMLAEVLGDLPLDFLVLFSSITALTGGLGQVDYCAANAYLDAFATARGACGKYTTVAIAWDAWEYDSWQQRSARVAPELYARLREIRTRFGIRFDEGFEVLQRVLGTGLPQIVISTRDLETTRRAHRVTADALLSRRQEPAERRDGVAASARPQGEIEAIVADVWQKVLGVPHVGRHDDFVELGGHSLLAIQLTSQLAEALDTEIPLRAVFEHPTVEKLAAFISGQETLVEAGEDDLEQILQQVEGLSEEAAQQRLEEILTSPDGEPATGGLTEE